MKKFFLKFKQTKIPIILGTVLALFVSLFLIGLIGDALSGSGQQIKFVSDKSIFQSNEQPTFQLVYKNKTNIFYRFTGAILGIFGGSKDEAPEIKTRIFQSNGKEIDSIASEIKYENGKISLDLNHNHFQQEFKPGKYKLEVEINDNGKIYKQNQEFVYGVLAINVNKSIYTPGETANLQFAALTDTGYTRCDAKLKLEITNPKGKKTVLSTEDQSIKYSGLCKGDNVVDVPDYSANYKTEGVGEYEMKLTNLDNGYEITDYFEVRESVPFDVERTGPTRIYPPAKYEIKLKIKANQDFSGEIVETVPMTFMVEEKTGAKQNSFIENYIKTITWQTNIKNGETKEFVYTFDAPDISPYFYLIGPLKIGGWQEARKWQIASDAIASGIIIPWFGLVSDIPSGWSREPDLDGYYLYGVTASASGTGGQATHTHAEASGGHTHSIEHNHGGSFTSAPSDGTAVSAGALGTGAAADHHTHTLNIATNTGGTNVASASDSELSTGSNDLPRYEVVFIKSNGAPTGIPKNGWAYFKSDSLPDGWTRLAGDRFLKGAAVGQDGQTNTTTGSDSHTHTDSGHKHTETLHSHTVSSGNSWLANTVVKSGTSAAAATTQNHTITDNGSATATEQSASALFANADGQPPWDKMNLASNGNASDDLPDGTIALWLGPSATPPVGWYLCNGSNDTPDLENTFVKAAVADGQSSVSYGGSASGHIHDTAGAHTHTIDVHPHAPTIANNSSAATSKNTGSAAPTTHGHPSSSFTCVTNCGSTGSASPTLAANSSTTHYPSYRQVNYIMYKAPKTISGTCKKADQSTNCEEAATIKVAYDGVIQAETASSSGGSWTITVSSLPTSGQVVTVFVDNVDDSNEAVAVTKYDGSDNISGMLLYEMHLAIGSDDAGVTVSNTNLSQYDATKGNENIFYKATATTLEVCYLAGCESAELYIKLGNTYQPNSSGSSYVKTHDIEIDGTFDMTSGAGVNYASVSGGWDNDSVFTADDSTIFFTATASEEIVSASAGSTVIFNNVQFGDNATTSAKTGHWDLKGTATPFDVDGNLTIGGGTLHGLKNITLAGNLTLSVDGDYLKDDYTFTFNKAGTQTWTDSRAAPADMGQVSISGTAVTLGSSVKVNELTIASGKILDLGSSGYTLTIGGDGQTTARPLQLQNSGILDCGTNSYVEYIASQSTDIEDVDYYNLKLASASTTFNITGSAATIVTSGSFSIDAGTFDGEDDTVTLKKTSTGAFSVSGAFTPNTSTFNYAGDGNTTIASGSYYNLQAGNITTNTANRIYTLQGNTTVSKLLTVGAGSGTSTNSLDASSYTLTLSGTDTVFTVNSKGGFTASTGTVVYEGTAATNITALNGANHYYNLTVGLSSDTGTFSYTVAGEIEASGSVTLVPGSSGVHTFDMSTNNLSVGGGAASTGGIDVPAGTVFTQTSGTTKVYSSSGSATIGGTGTTKFYTFVVGNASDGASYTFNLDGDVGASNSFTLAAGTHTLALFSYEFGVYGNFTVGGSSASVSAQTSTINLGGTVDTTLTNSGSLEPYNLTINKIGADTDDDLNLTSNLTVRNTITIIDGELPQGIYDLRAEGGTIAVSIEENGEWNNVSTGDLVLGGTFTNAGSVSFSAADVECSGGGGADTISITSTTAGQARTWTNTGTIFLYNIAAQDQADAAITCTSCTNTGESSTWKFENCPAAGPLITQAHFRWRSDNDNEINAAWKQSEDIIHTSQAKSENLRLRFSITNTGTNGTGYQFELQVAPRGASANCEDVASTSYSLVSITGGCGSAVACMTPSDNFADGDATTTQLSPTGTFVTGKMVEDSSNITGSINIDEDYYTEAEYNFQFTTNAANGTYYCFRTVNNGVPLDTYTNVAEISTSGGGILRILGKLRIKGSTLFK